MGIPIPMVGSLFYIDKRRYLAEGSAMARVRAFARAVAVAMAVIGNSDGCGGNTTIN